MTDAAHPVGTGSAAPASPGEAQSGRDPLAAERVAGTTWRLRLVATCIALAALTFHQAPGQIAPDTKLDLTANPWGFLGRALTLWDGSQFGQLQNQAYGYLFPVGPFHAVLMGVGIPAWVVQRLWWTTVLVTAFLGLWRLARALGLGTAWTRYLGALAFALGARFLGEVAVTSVEVWPMAVAPWVMVPLVDPRLTSVRSRVLRSASAVAVLGGVNAVASGAALVLPALWWATRRPLRGALPGAIGWLAAVLAATAWWLGPLLVLGRFSPPFLDWIETAAVTTGTASPFAALQGTTPWVGYLATLQGPSWPAMFALVTVPLLVLLTSAVAVLGLVGLADPGLPHRGWLRWSALVGFALTTAGFSGSTSGPWSAPVQSLLDGPLAPLRNTHKFALVLGIPLLLAVVHAGARLSGIRLVRALPRRVVGLTTGLLVVALAGPGIAGVLPRPGAYDGIPEHWRQAAAWLDASEHPGTVLVVPAASFADFTWGSTKDEPLQPLMRRPFAVRDAVPLGSAGATRLLDEVGRALATGRGGPGLEPALASAGVGFLVVRNDLTYQGGAEPMAVHEALAESGLDRVATFGPAAGSPIETPNRTLNERTLLPYPSVEVYAVDGVRGPTLLPVSALPTGTAAPEDLPALRAAGLPAALVAPGSAAATSAGGPTIATDGMRRREMDFGAGSGRSSAVLEAGDLGRAGRRRVDIADPTAPATTLRWGDGLVGVTSSSSASDATATVALGSGNGPAAAVDGDPGTDWVSGRYAEPIGQWLQLDFDRPRSVEGLTAIFGTRLPGVARATQVAVTTDAGAATSPVLGAGSVTPLATVPGETRTLRITLTGVGPGNPMAFDIAELGLPDFAPQQWLVTPDAGTTADHVLLRVQDQGRDGCLFAAERPLCSPRLVVDPEEAGGIRRIVTTATSADYTWTGTVLPRPSAELDALLDLPARPLVSASSRATQAPAARPATVLDGDLGTGWVAASSDTEPTLTVTLPSARPVAGVQILVDQFLAASRPNRLRIEVGGRTVTGDLDAEGYLRLAEPVTADRILVQVLRSEIVGSVDAVTGYATLLPPGISELRVLGADDLRVPLDPGTAVGLPCGLGPTLSVDGVSRPSEVIGTAREVLRSMPLQWRACGPDEPVAAGRVALGAGAHRIAATSTTTFRPVSLRLDRVGADAGVAELPLVSTGDRIDVPDRAEPVLVTLPQNANAGWTATLTPAAGPAAGSAGGSEVGTTVGSSPATPITVGGWRQGWLLPAGPAGTLTLSYTPRGPYLALLALGAVLLVGLLALTWHTARRPRGSATPPMPERVGGLALVAATGVVLTGGFGVVGVVAFALGLVGARLGHRWPRWLPMLVALPATLAVAAVAAAPWTRGGAAIGSQPVQLGVLAALVVTLSASSLGSPPERS